MSAGRDSAFEKYVHIVFPDLGKAVAVIKTPGVRAAQNGQSYDFLSCIGLF